jgi:hypothetical protein
MAHPIPRAVRLFEANKAALPRSGVRLDVCKILERVWKGCIDHNCMNGTPRWLLPDEVLDDGQSPSVSAWCAWPAAVIVAFDFWCTAGIEDNGSVGPHFSRNINPMVSVEIYDDGVVIYGNHCKKADVPRTEAGEQATERFLERVQAGEHIDYDIRGARFGTFQYTCFPVAKGD